MGRSAKGVEKFFERVAGNRVAMHLAYYDGRAVDGMASSTSRATRAGAPCGR